VTPPTPLAIETSGLAKKFGNTTAVDSLDLAVHAGVVYGILGPNGSGKTTLIRMLTTLLRPDGGTARVYGYDVVRDADAVRQRISLTGQFSSVDDGLTGVENLVLMARLHGMAWAAARSRAEQLLEVFGLADAAHRLVKTYSGGMRRRLDIAASIVVTPDLLFLDEPTTGLDPSSRNQLWDIVRAIVDAGTTVLLTTQYLEEADQLADGIAVINRGRVIATGTPAELKSSVGSGALHLRLQDSSQLPDAERILARELHVAVQRGASPAALWARTSDSARVTQALAALTHSGVDVAEFTLGQPSLDEVFLALTGSTTTTDTDRSTERGAA
jgi:ABC-2 type transport system ATP-binding protein